MNKELSDINQASLTALKKCLLTPEQYVSDLNGMLVSFLLSKNEFKVTSNQFFKQKENVNTIKEARVLKVKLDKNGKRKESTLEEKIRAKESIRLHNHI